MEQIPLNITKTSMKSPPNIPVINLSDPDAKHIIVKASEEFGFFKVINHGVNMDFITKLEAEAMEFFVLPQAEKEKAGPPNPFGYGNKSIGFNGDAGCIEYLLFPIKANLEFGDNLESFRSPLSEYVSEHCGVKPRKLNVDLGQNPENFRCVLRDYVSAVNKMSSVLLELMADGLRIQPRQVFSRLIMDEESESMFRINHYPPCLELLQASDGTNMLGFGAHTDPQIISVLRANEASGYEILLRDGTWVSVSPDPNSFFVNIGDSLQVMTNGRFRSVRHRVLANSRKSRLSMVYFAAPPMRETIGPMPSLMGADQPSLYKELTWFEYITNAHNNPLGHDRLSFFERIVST